MLALNFGNVSYLSQGDETAFFNWLNSIDCVNGIDGEGSELNVVISSKEISEEDLRDLIAISARYEVDMTQLLVFENTSITKWFTMNKDAYWYKRLVA